MGTRMSLLLALLLVMYSSSYSRIADGVRMAPPLGAAGHAAAATSSTTRSTDEPDRRTAAWAAGREELMRERRAATGSRLPDCAHACGPCSPCRRVMVSFMCAQASESCPVAYRCMCRGRFFRVPLL